MIYSLLIFLDGPLIHSTLNQQTISDYSLYATFIIQQSTDMHAFDV